VAGNNSSPAPSLAASRVNGDPQDHRGGPTEVSPGGQALCQCTCQSRLRKSLNAGRHKSDLNFLFISFLVECTSPDGRNTRGTFSSSILVYWNLVPIRGPKFPTIACHSYECFRAAVAHWIRKAAFCYRSVKILARSEVHGT